MLWPMYLIICEVANIAGRVASPQLTLGNQATRGQDTAGSQDGPLLHQRPLHQNGPVSDDAVGTHIGRAEHAPLTNCDMPADGGCC